MSRQQREIEGGRGRDPWLWVLVAASAAQWLCLAFHLVYPDLVLDYPFPGGDGQDWISNGLFLAGADVRYSARPPLVPLVLAGLDQLSALSLFPLLNLALVHAALVGLYLLLRRVFAPQTAFATTLALLINGALLGFGLEVMADAAASCLLLGSLAAYHLSANHLAWRRTGLYALAGAFGGLSYLTQQTALLLPFALGLHGLAVRRARRERSSSGLWGPILGLGIFALAPFGWVLVRRHLIGTYGDLLVRQWGLLRPHLDGVGHYLWATLAFFGWPAVLLAVWGGVSFLGARGSRRRDEAPGEGLAERWDLVSSSLFVLAVVGFFFVVLYDYADKRFLLYGLFPGAVLLAAGFEDLLSRWGSRALAGAALVTVAVSAAAFPGSAGTAEEVALWPAPYLYARVPGEMEPTGALRLRPLAAELGTAPVQSLWNRIPWVRVARARASFWSGVSRPSPSLVAGDRGVVFLYPPGEENRRYRLQGRLGNALGKRVKLLPGAYLVGAWSELCPHDEGRVLGYRAYHLEPPGLDGRWLLLLGPGVEGPAEADLGGAACGTARRPREPAAGALEGAWAVARAVGPGLPPVLVRCDLSRPSLLRAYLPFVLPTTEMFVEPRRPGESPSGWIETPSEGEVVEGAAGEESFRVWPLRARGLRGFVIDLP